MVCVLAGKSDRTAFDQTPLTIKHELLMTFVLLWYLWAETKHNELNLLKAKPRKVLDWCLCVPGLVQQAP